MAYSEGLMARCAVALGLPNLLTNRPWKLFKISNKVKQKVNLENYMLIPMKRKHKIKESKKCTKNKQKKRMQPMGRD